MKPDIWINGEFVPWDKAGIHPLSFSMQRGATLFESIACNEADDGRSAIFRLRDHMLRLENSARIIGMKLDYDIENLVQAVVDTVVRSGLKECVIRPLAFYADPVMEVYPGNIPTTVVIGLGETHFPPEYYRLTISRLRKIDGTSMPVKAKVSGNYIGPMIAKSEAIKAGFDDTILLDTEGYVAEGATSSIFIVERGKLVTAPLDKILPGITRDTVNIIAPELGIKVIQEKFPQERLKNADEVILCSSGNEVTPIIQVDNRVIADGTPGPVALRLRSYYADIIVGRVQGFEHWFTYV
ncbi:aminotransferase class IV [Candidatus Latescibacterota bacterium]